MAGRQQHVADFVRGDVAQTQAPGHAAGLGGFLHTVVEKGDEGAGAAVGGPQRIAAGSAIKGGAGGFGTGQDSQDQLGGA